MDLNNISWGRHVILVNKVHRRNGELTCESKSLNPIKPGLVAPSELYAAEEERKRREVKGKEEGRGSREGWRGGEEGEEKRGEEKGGGEGEGEGEGEEKRGEEKRGEEKEGREAKRGEEKGRGGEGRGGEGGEEGREKMGKK